jgi:enterochelin esterase-like enzyme
MRYLRSYGLVFLLLLIAAPGHTQADGRLIDWDQVTSAHVQPRNVTIWLPPGYDTSHRRYPVIYMHDGQNIFVPGRAYGGEEWGVDEAMSRMIAARRTRGAIIVGVWNTSLRGREYLPANVVAALPEAERARVLASHGGHSLADAYLRFLVSELKPRIDREFRTLAGARHTSIIGSSMGGLISLYALGEYPRVFGQAAAVSIHWPLGDPRQGLGADPLVVANAFRVWLASSNPDARRNRLYVDIGDQTLDAYYPPYQAAMVPVFEEHGWRNGSRFALRTYPGTSHNEAAWRARVETPLAFLLGLRN